MQNSLSCPSVALVCRGRSCGPAGGGFEPRARRLATVARTEPRRAARPRTGLLKAWPAGGPPLAWRATGAGEGYSSFAVSGGRLYTLGARGGTEYVIAFDAASGKRLWETAHGTRFSNDRGDGPRATPTIDGDRVYAFGASGDLSVLDAATGKIALDRQRAEAVPRLEHPVGAERIAARPRATASSSTPAARSSRCRRPTGR